MRDLLSPLACVLFLTACAPHATEVAATGPGADSSRNALDWPGSYTGVLPCADCAGIATTLHLDSSGSYVLETIYLDQHEEPMATEGIFVWNEAGTTIKLSGDGQQFQVGEEQLFQLDLDGQRITGDMADLYTLRKVQGAPVHAAGMRTLVGTRWQLHTLEGRPMPSDLLTAPFLLLNSDSSANGNAGCNHFFGQYHTTEPGGLRFGDMASTQMACTRMDIEDALHPALRKVTGYTLKGDTLDLQDAGAMTLARFVAVPATE